MKEYISQERQSMSGLVLQALNESFIFFVFISRTSKKYYSNLLNLGPVHRPFNVSCIFPGRLDIFVLPSNKMQWIFFGRFDKDAVYGLKLKMVQHCSYGSLCTQVSGLEIKIFQLKTSSSHNQKQLRSGMVFSNENIHWLVKF